MGPTGPEPAAGLAQHRAARRLRRPRWFSCFSSPSPGVSPVSGFHQSVLCFVKWTQEDGELGKGLQ